MIPDVAQLGGGNKCTTPGEAMQLQPRLDHALWRHHDLIVVLSGLSVFLRRA